MPGPQAHLVAARGVRVQAGDRCLELKAGNLPGSTAVQEQLPGPQVPCPVGPDRQGPITAGSGLKCDLQAG